MKVVAFHRTYKEINAQSICKNGFDNTIHHSEIYLAATWESANSLDGGTGSDYGSYLLRCKVDTSDFPKTGHKEKGGDGEILVIKDASIISDIEYTVMNIDDPKYWVNGVVGEKFINPFPTPDNFNWKT